MGEKRVKSFVLGIILVLAVSGCVKVSRSFRALTYKNQIVALDKNHYYKVGPLSNEWRQTNSNPGIVFANTINRATIATEAFCGGAYEDTPLKLAVDEVLAGLQNVHRIKTEEWILSSRAALYTRVNATLDGVPVQLNVVVVKKDGCEFDFYSITAPRFADAVAADFLSFVKGFDD